MNSSAESKQRQRQQQQQHWFDTSSWSWIEILDSENIVFSVAFMSLKPKIQNSPTERSDCPTERSDCPTCASDRASHHFAFHQVSENLRGTRHSKTPPIGGVFSVLTRS